MIDESFEGGLPIMKTHQDTHGFGAALRPKSLNAGASVLPWNEPRL